MRMENTAKTHNLDSDESLSLEELKNGEYKVIAKRECFGIDEEKESEVIEMIYTKNGLNALLGCWLAMVRQTELRGKTDA